MSNFYISKCCGEQVTPCEYNGRWDCSKCHRCCEVTAMLDKPNGVPEANFMQVGRTQICGHCNPKRFGEGLKQALEINPNYVCECVCHDEATTARKEKISSKLAVDKTEQIRDILFDFWSAMRDKESDNRDNHVEKVIEKFETLLSEQRQTILEEENRSWLEGERCYTCGKYKKPSRTSDRGSRF